MKWFSIIFALAFFMLSLCHQGRANLHGRNVLNVGVTDSHSTEGKTMKRGYDSWLNDDSENTTKPVTSKVEKKPDKLSYRDGNGGNDDYDILTEEGKEGWMEKLLKKVKAKNKNKKPSGSRQYKDEGTIGSKLYDDIPSSTLTKLTNGFSAIGVKAEGAKNGLSSLKSQWNDISFGDRAVVTQTLQSAASNIEKFANAGDDPLAAVQGAINMVAQFAALAGPTGQIISVALSFVSGFLSLFGAGGTKQKSVGEIVREEIDAALDQFYENTLSNQARGIVSTFDASKAYVDFLAQRGTKLTKEQALSLKADVPLWQGLPIMGTLASEIRNLIRTNKKADAKKALRYIELYTKIAVMKDMILQETAALMPDELAPNRGALLATQVQLRSTQKNLLKFLYEGSLSNNVLPFFDPDVNPVTDSYLNTILKVPNYDRSLAGIWCLTPNMGRPYTPLSWYDDESGLMKDGHPYVARGNDGCFWKLIPHGNHRFTVQNMYKCPGYKHCGKYLNSDATGGNMNNRATIEEYPDIWEIYGVHQKRIRSKWGCSSESQWCNLQLGPQTESYGFLGFSRKQTFKLRTDNVGYVWHVTKKPM